ncbi:hypothetical protein, partial [Ralstonia solanacearum]
ACPDAPPPIRAWPTGSILGLCNAFAWAGSFSDGVPGRARTLRKMDRIALQRRSSAQKIDP